MAQGWSLRQDNTQALALSQQASHILRKLATATVFKIPIHGFARSESADQWSECERLFFSCLRTGDDQSAFLCLEKLTERFGATDQKIIGLHGVYQEAVAPSEHALQEVLKSYNKTLAEDPSNIAVAKRRIALLRHLGQSTEAAQRLTELLDSSPTDIEAWSELADLSTCHGLYPRAIFCLEEILLTTPNAWNIHAWIGDITYRAAVEDHGDDQLLLNAIKRYCRSVELCDGYLRGYYGIKMSTDHLLQRLESSDAMRQLCEKNDMSRDVVMALNAQATAQLRKAINLGTEAGHGKGELAAARLLLE